MKAYTKSKYGGPEVLQFEEVSKPTVKEEHLLVKIKANSVNPVDWHVLRGKPYLARLAFGLFKPKDKIPGADFSGIVEEVGSNVTSFKVGDYVFGESIKAGVYAEYACVEAGVCAKMPEGAAFADMACVPIAGLTALQAVVTHGKLQKGESVLINGGSGGVGHFTIQIAKAYGAEVTAVCSEKNTEFVQNLGADHVIAYDKQNIHEHTGKYNLVIDVQGNLHFNDFTRMGQRGLIIGFTTLGHFFPLLLKKVISKFSLTLFTAQANTPDLETLAKLIQDKKMKVAIDKTFSFRDIPAAIGYIESMRTKGKVAMVWDDAVY
jgi:NADPH:quinone reductase-like Zn-dependent oxidoreductase